MILGAYSAKKLLVEHVKERMPAAVAARRALLEHGQKLPDVAEWHTRWIPHSAVSSWPMVYVTALRSTNEGRLDWVDGDPLHRFRWTLRLFVWVRGEGYDETALRVELLATALAEVLLANPKLADGVKVEDQPLSISLSDIEREPKTKASMAGAYVEVVVTMDETASSVPLATADDVLLEVGPMPED